VLTLGTATDSPANGATHLPRGSVQSLAPGVSGRTHTGKAWNYASFRLLREAMA
jgi:hypothetical protein